MRILALLVTVLGAAVVRVRVRMGSMVLIISAMLSVVVIGAATILVVPEGHALGSRHGRNALDREGQGEQRDSKNPDTLKQHRRKLYASRFECRPPPGFRRPAHFLPRRHNSHETLHR